MIFTIEFCSTVPRWRMVSLRMRWADTRDEIQGKVVLSNMQVTTHVLETFLFIVVIPLYFCIVVKKNIYIKIRDSISRCNDISYDPYTPFHFPISYKGFQKLINGLNWKNIRKSSYPTKVWASVLWATYSFPWELTLLPHLPLTV